MRNDIVDILLELGIPAGVKGFTYIHDALELFDTDTYYSSGKICSLYADIALKRGTTPSSVERAIRHAFETVTTKGNREVVEQYLDLVNTQNSNLLRTLYFRLKQRRNQQQPQTAPESLLSARLPHKTKFLLLSYITASHSYKFCKIFSVSFYL